MTNGWPEEMSCQELVELVTEYLEETLDAPVRDRFDTHLAKCPGCTDYLAQMRLTLNLSGKLEPDAISPDVRDKLLDAFRGWSET